MDKGIYAAGSGGFLNLKRIEILSNNLANASTVGFKAERLISRQQEFSDTLASRMGDLPKETGDYFEQTPGAVQIGSETDFSQGPVADTGNPLNVALATANSFFVVQTPKGEAYTRAGNFSLDSGGQLVTPDGMPVMGTAGPISLPQGKSNIDSSGVVSVDGNPVGQLRVVEIDNLKDLRRTEGTRFVAEGGAQAREVPADLIVGAVEMPNISIVEAMVELISANRAFEAYTKTTKTIDDLNERAIRNARASG